LYGVLKPGMGTVFWPFTVMVVAREIPTAIPTMLSMMIAIAKLTRNNSFTLLCLFIIEKKVFYLWPRLFKNHHVHANMV
jgi:hypothetical protein